MWPGGSGVAPSQKKSGLGERHIEKEKSTV